MSDRKPMQLSHGKKTTSTEEEPVRQSHSSLDKFEKKQFSNKLQNALQSKKNSSLIFKFSQDEKDQNGKNKEITDEWPTSNKRRYLKNYQLPKINSPIKLKREQISKFQVETNQNVNDDEQKIVLQKKSVTLQTNSPSKKHRLAPMKAINNYPHVIKTKAGTNGKQAKINQDVAIVQQKLPHNIKLYCICDGHGLNGHLVSAFIKTNLIKNLNGPLKKYHNIPDRQKFTEIVYLALQTTNQQLLDCDINTELAGSTLVAVFLYQQRLITFNVGDSRAILLQQVKTDLCKQEEKQQKKILQLSHKKPIQDCQWVVVPLSVDQKPERPDQKQRILKYGGRVFAQTNEEGQQIGPARVWMKDIMMPGLAMTRSFGDKAGIKAGTNAQPEMHEHVIENCDKLIVIASDGVWEYMENQQVMKIVVTGYLKEDLQISGDNLLKKAVDTWTKMNFARDDITFIIVKLNQPQK